MFYCFNIFCFTFHCLEFSQEVYDWLCTADPIRHVAPQSDPFIYRLHEVRGTINTVKSSRNLQAISIYGPAIKAVTEEEFGQKGLFLNDAE